MIIEYLMIFLILLFSFGSFVFIKQLMRRQRMFYINFINSFQKIYDIENEVIDNSGLLLEKIRRLEIELIDSKYITSEDKNELLKELKDENAYAKEEKKSRHEKNNATKQWLEIMKKDMDD